MKQGHKPQEPMVRAEHLYFSYNKQDVLVDVSFSLPRGEFVALVGPNGSGKTTLVKLLLGLLAPDSGRIHLFGTSVQEFEERHRIGYVPQHHAINKQFPATVRELLGLKSGSDTKQVIAALEIDDLLDKQFVSLSGGQQQKVLIALAFLSKPDLLILDEPTVGVDIKSQQEFYRFLRTMHRDRGVSIILVSHDVGIISKYVTSVLVLNKSVCCYGATKELPVLLSKAYGRDVHIHHHEHDH